MGDNRPETAELSSFVQAAVGELIKVIDEGVIKSLKFDGINLAGIRHTGENQQVAALNNDDMSRNTSGQGQGIV